MLFLLCCNLIIWNCDLIELWYVVNCNVCELFFYFGVEIWFVCCWLLDFVFEKILFVIYKFMLMCLCWWMIFIYFRSSEELIWRFLFFLRILKIGKIVLSRWNFFFKFIFSFISELLFNICFLFYILYFIDVNWINKMLLCFGDVGNVCWVFVSVCKFKILFLFGVLKWIELFILYCNKV